MAYRSDNHSSRSSNRYPQNEYDRTRSYSSRKKRPYQKKSWTIGGWRFTARTVYILVGFIICLILLIAGISAIRAHIKKSREPVPVSEASTAEESAAEAEEASEPEPEPPVVTENWSGMDDLGSRQVEISRFFSYGTHLFLQGSLDTLPAVTNIQLVLRPVHQAIDLATYDTDWYSEGGTTYFNSAERINAGVYLEEIPEGSYALLVKLTASTGDVQYRTLVDATTDESPIEYYTITRNGKNNKILINTYTDSVHGVNYFGLDVAETVLPDDVYDFVIDPGHGGNDGGCSSPDGQYLERDLVMTVGQRAYDLLTAEGYKVLLTRDGTEGDDRWMAFEFFDEDGRVTISYKAKAKYLVSIHINTVEDSAIHGFQVYDSVRSDHTLGIALGEGLTEKTNIEPAASTYNMVAPGVYFKLLSDYYVDGLFNNTDYLAMVRELGGIATGAMQVADGQYEENRYRFSNQTVEASLVELGFISNEGDMREMVDNNDTFADAIVAGYNKVLDNVTMLDPATAPEAVPSPDARAAAAAASENAAAPDSTTDETVEPEPIVKDSNTESTE